MEKIRARIRMSFRAKVLVPVIAVMVLLMAVTMFVVNLHLTRQAENDARETLATAVDVFRNSQSIRTKSLFLRFRTLPNEPRYKGALQTLHPDTVRSQLATALTEQEVDFVLFTPSPALATDDLSDTSPQIQKRDQLIPAPAFISATARVVGHALHGEEKADTVRVRERLFDVVSVPVYGIGNVMIGALTFGQEVGWEVAREFSGVTHGPIVLLAGGRVIASTLPNNDCDAELAAMYRELSNVSVKGSTFGVRKAVLAGARYFYSGGSFSGLDNDEGQGFLCLRSSEGPLQALWVTQQLLLLASLAAILLGTLIVCFLVGKVTAPLSELRDSAEAVGQGDFSRRVEIRTEDECGELARVFNQMLQNLKNSREQLEMTVETLKTTQAQLIQSEKLSGIGEFIAGVAHELNNPLASVMGFSELLRNAPDADPKQKRHLEMIHKCAQRCQKIVQALLSFARRRAPERKVVCVNELIEAAAEILTYQLRTSNVQIQLNLNPHLPLAMVDPHQIQQVFVNLINNARQAIESHSPQGWIKIGTETRGHFVRIVVQDSGPGIVPENLSKIFDPFFTTKDVGQGTGLGLSMCYGIIKDHGGTITPVSKPGEGAIFIIKLPITHEAVGDHDEETSLNTEFINAREGAGKRVLVIDDEEPILQMVREALTLRGYEVDIAADGEAALLQLSRARYDVAICDWKMPGLNGREIYERVREQNPAQAERFIFITGDVITDRTQKFFEQRQRPCLPKPFSLHDFRGAVRKILADKNPSLSVNSQN
ncbi:MAG: hybrid sensor histidine kinase/response regulator [Verrucomicrobiota bacterium]